MRLVLRILDTAMAALAAALVAATACATVAAVFFRSIVGASLPWPEELSGNLLVWTSFAGAYLAARDRGHIAFDLLVVKLPFRFRRAVLTFNDALLTVFFLLLVWLSWQMISVVGGTPLETLPLPKGVFMAALPVGGATLIVAILIRAYARWRGPEAEEHQGGSEPR